MASNRHLGRIVTLQSLYEYEFRVDTKDDTVDIDEIVKRNLERYKTAIDDKDFVYSLSRDVLSKLEYLDNKIQPIAPDWPINQVSRIDRMILRIGMYELLDDTSAAPPKVVINEAVELAKAFGSDNSSKFINGVLGTAYRKLSEGKADNAEPEVRKI